MITIITQKKLMPLVGEIYDAGTVPIVSRTLISLYVEVIECDGNIANIKVGRVSEIDPRVDTNQLWTGQVDGERFNLIVIYYNIDRMRKSRGRAKPIN